MRHSAGLRTSMLLLAVGLVGGATSCGTGGPNDPFHLFRRIILDGLGVGRGVLEPGGQSLLFGPMPSADSTEAAALAYRLTCLSGPGVVRARWLFDDAQSGLTPAAESFGFSEDLVDLLLGAGPLDDNLGHFRGDAVSRLYLEVRLPAGEPRTEVQLDVQLARSPLDQTFDLEPNNEPDGAVTVQRQDDGSLPPAPGVMSPVFGDIVDYYRVLPDGLGDGIEVETVEPRGARTTVEVTDNGTIVLGGLTDERVDVTPLLGDIPLIGRLFRTRPEDGERRSLMIFVTPRIINGD